MLLDRARGNSRRDIDYLLAQKVVGAGSNTRRAAVIEWQDADRLTSWRFGMAASVGLAVPDELYATVGPHVLAWKARAPMYHPEDRIGAARVAATLGVFSNAALVELYSEIADREGDVGRDAPAAKLRAAYIGDDPGERVAAGLRALGLQAPQLVADSAEDQDLVAALVRWRSSVSGA